MIYAESWRLIADGFFMLSDSAILKHIARQPQKTAGFKQLVRELGLHGDEHASNSDELKDGCGQALFW